MRDRCTYTALMAARSTTSVAGGGGLEVNGSANPTPVIPAWRTIAASIDARTDRLVKFRRRIHAQPEPSGEEVATTALVAETLREAGLKPRMMKGDVGLVVDLDIGAAHDSLIAGRAELDAVNVSDEKQVPYASTREGLCHACGHDAHTTMLLGAALTIAEHRDAIAESKPLHNLRFIFQPSEETATGARSMIEQGAIEGVAAIMALHVEPFLPTGTIGVRRGAMTAACKTFRIGIRGRSGHSARPHEAIDPIPAAINLVSMLYQLAPRSIDSRNPLALTVAAINAGSSFNAIPDSAVISGTLRTARVEDIEAVQARMDSVCRGIAESTGCEVELKFPEYAPPTENDLAVLSAMAEAGHDVLGPEAVQWLEVPSMGAEDFAFYQELIPGAFARLGVANPKKEPRHRRPLHSSHFDIDENALPLGAKVMARSLLDLASGYAHRPA